MCFCELISSLIVLEKQQQHEKKNSSAKHMGHRLSGSVSWSPTTQLFPCYKRLRAMSLLIKTVLYALNRHFTAAQVKYEHQAFLTLLKVHTDLPKTTKQLSSFKCFLINFAQIFPIHYKLKCLQKIHIYDIVFTPSICDYNLCFDKT